MHNEVVELRQSRTRHSRDAKDGAAAANPKIASPDRYSKVGIVRGLRHLHQHIMWTSCSLNAFGCHSLISWFPRAIAVEVGK